MTHRSMRILHLSTELPTDPGESGGSTRQFRLLASLAKQGNDVTVVSPVTAAQQRLDPARALNGVGVQLIATQRQATREREVLAGLRRSPGLMWRAAVMPFYTMQAELLALEMAPGITRAMASRPDVVSIELDYSAALGDDLPPDVPRVLMLQNVTGAYYASRATSSRGLRRVAYATESWRAHRYITPRLSSFARLIVVSEDDAALLRSRTPTPIDIVPNGTSIGPGLAAAAGRPNVLFTGTMSYPPNREGILWFHERVWPQVRQEVPEARLAIVGRYPDPDVLALADRDSSVRITGAVPDMTPFFAEATVVVAPLHAGGGTRLKILDAFAAGRAVVSTSTGAEGLEVANGEHLLIADDASSFAAATVRLLKDRSLQDNIAARGRQLAENRYDWDALGNRLGEILQTVVEDPGHLG